MLIYLTEYLAAFHSGFNVFQYLTLRTILGVLTALMIALVIGPAMIRSLAALQISQNIRDDGPQSHLSKAGTPTMGGLLILVSIAISTLLWSELGNRFVWIVLGCTMAFGAIGLADDYLKVVRGNAKGLSARQKYAWQSVVGIGVAVFLYVTAKTSVETTLIVPFIKDIAIDLGIFYIVFTYFVIAASLLAALITTLLHLPHWITKPFMRVVPVWAQAIGVHAFGYLVGGVTGHVVGALMSLPYYYLAEKWLKVCILGR